MLISALLQDAWRHGQTLDVASLIGGVQKPPVTKVGVLDLESFYPAAERFQLAMRLNQLAAAPDFAVWLEGEALDVSRLLYTATGKPRVSVISISHLDDRERMFFVSLLLNEVVGWVRTQRGTSSLRAIIYFDEVFGFLPPVANPSSKAPLLTLLKQARAFGVGMVLATQNPIDLDYKALSNTGTWFLGRLQTQRDKDRLLDGLENVSAASGNRASMDATLSSLEKRMFLMHNVHDAAPTLFQTRWTMSYLRGPLGRDEIARLAKVPGVPGVPGVPRVPQVLVPEVPDVPRAEVRAPSAPSAPSGTFGTFGTCRHPRHPRHLRHSRQCSILLSSNIFAPGGGAVYEPALLGARATLLQRREAWRRRHARRCRHHANRRRRRPCRLGSGGRRAVHVAGSRPASPLRDFLCAAAFERGPAEKICQVGEGAGAMGRVRHRASKCCEARARN